MFCLPLLAAAVHFITVHGVDGREIVLNIEAISSIRTFSDKDLQGGQYPSGANCVIFMSDGKLIYLAEPCREVVKKIGKAIEDDDAIIK